MASQASEMRVTSRSAKLKMIRSSLERGMCSLSPASIGSPPPPKRRVMHPARGRQQRIIRSVDARFLNLGPPRSEVLAHIGAIPPGIRSLVLAKGVLFRFLDERCGGFRGFEVVGCSLVFALHRVVLRDQGPADGVFGAVAADSEHPVAP